MLWRDGSGAGRASERAAGQSAGAYRPALPGEMVRQDIQELGWAWGGRWQ